MNPLQTLRHHVSGAIERGEAVAIVEQKPATYKNMKTRIFVGASHAYCCIQTDEKSLDVLLEGGRSAAQSLRETAEQWRKDAARLLKNAELAENAAASL